MGFLKPNIEKLESKHDVDGLRKALYNRDLQISQQAIRALGRIGDRKSIDALGGFVMKKEAVPESQIPFLVETLISYLKKEETRLSIDALGLLGDSKAVEPLIKIVRSSRKKWALEAAANSLRLLGETQAIEDRALDEKLLCKEWGFKGLDYELLEALIGKDAAQILKEDYLAHEPQILEERRERYKKENEEWMKRRMNEEERIRSAGIGGHFEDPEEAVNFLFQNKIAKLPVLTEAQNDEMVQIAKNTLGIQTTVIGSQDEINSILTKNVSRLSQRTGYHHFIIEPYPEESNEISAVIKIGTWKDLQFLIVYIWQTSTKLVAYGHPELLITEDTREEWEPILLLDLLKDADSYSTSGVYRKSFEKFPQYNQIRYHGENIYKRNGLQGMQGIYQELINKYPSNPALRMLDRFWDGIGPWRA